MTPEDVVASFVDRFADVHGEVAYGQPTVDVSVTQWLDAMSFARDELGASYFDWLTAVDELDRGFAVVAHLWSVEQRFHVLVRTTVPRDAPSLPSATSVFAGAAWHERETHEMFGVQFEGFDDGSGRGLRPLLLPDGFEGRPLRKDFVLAARVAKPWPGAKEPGESEAEAGAPGRRKTLPPGVPEPGAWGPRPPGSQVPSVPVGGEEGGTAPGDRPRRRREGPRRTRSQAEATPGAPAEPPAAEALGTPPATAPEAEQSAPAEPPQEQS